MTIDKAISTLQEWIPELIAAGYREHIPAIRLGIEALRAVGESRWTTATSLTNILPGETA